MFKNLISSPAKIFGKKDEEEEEEGKLVEESEKLLEKKSDDKKDGGKPSSISRTWDVKISKLGLRLIKRPRRLSIDIIRDAEQATASPKTLLRGDSFGVHPEQDTLMRGDKVVFRILMEDHEKDNDDHDDSSDDEDDSITHIGHEPGWTEVRRQRLEGVEILKAHRNNTVDIRWGRSIETRIRHLHFRSKEDADSFCSVLKLLKAQEVNRAKQQIDAFKQTHQSGDKTRDLFGGGEGGGEEDIKLLIEVVSGIDLPPSDGDTTDAYCLIRLGDREVHRTQHVSKTLDPIWTVKNGSLALVSTTPDEFFGASSGMSFILRDMDAVGKDDTLGTLQVPHDDLLNGTGERKEFVIEPRRPQKKKSKLVLRYRRATAEDEKFMSTLATMKNKHGVYASETYVQPKATKVARLKRETRKGSIGQLEYRVKPTPDPKNEEGTKWMTESMIDEYSRKPSEQWIEAGSGKLARLYFELLGCDGLPNKDTKGVGGKTDAFACIVYEDCVVNTEVINDTLSPRWMPWTQRAFIFNTIHPSSQIFVGLFDWDGNMMDAHDPISRVTIDTTNLRPRTDYVLNYNLYTSALVTKRKNYGKITVRLRMEWLDQFKVMTSPLSLRKPQYVNLVNKRDSAVAFYTVNGKYDEHNFDTDIISSYVDELKSYLDLTDVVTDALMTVLLWRGHFPVGFGSCKVLLPLHSVVAFCGGVLLVENFDLIPSFFLLAVAWFFLSTMGYRRRHPSPWHECPSYMELFRAFVFHNYPPRTIEPNQNVEEIEKLNAIIERKREIKQAAEEKKLKEAEEDAKMEEEKAEEVDETTIMSGPSKGFSMNPLKPLLFPLQQNLKMICYMLRVVKSVVVWDESFQAFWIVTACVALGIPLLFVPWSFILRWLLRISVWLILGPWMKLVDVIYFKRRSQTTDAEEDAKRKAELKAKYEGMVAAAKHSQLKKEEAVKLRDMRKFKFGNFIVNVPNFKSARHFDYPLPPSMATRHDPETEHGKVVSRKVGQFLSGHMIQTSDEYLPDETAPLLSSDAAGYGSTS